MKKGEKPVIQVLREKHPNIHIPNINDPECASFEDYDEVPDPLPTQITADMVEQTASKLRGAGGPSSVDATSLSYWLLRFGNASA